MQPVPGRLIARCGVRGARIIDDTYNANPASLQAALDVLVAVPGEHWLALGDMAELGGDAAQLHAEIGRRARALGVRRLYGIGELAREACTAFGQGARHFVSPEELVKALRVELSAGVTVLVKGSRRMRMDQIVTALVADAGN